MIKPIKEPEVFLSEAEQEQMYWDELRFNSHRWIEIAKGYYQCYFCNASHTSAMPMNKKELCKDNPYIKQ